MSRLEEPPIFASHVYDIMVAYLVNHPTTAHSLIICNSDFNCHSASRTTLKQKGAVTRGSARILGLHLRVPKPLAIELSGPLSRFPHRHNINILL